ncbi:MAG: PilT protein domain protein [Acidobacteriaceae bacterium]|jgi:predicted nucleic acid-binding protein|nr:PilT protein domain protein [Acidobacteriaceae bacterium]
MNVLVDTPIWSLALRRKKGDLSTREQGLARGLEEVIREGRAQIIGPVRQELLSGIRNEGQFRSLRDNLRAFEEFSVEIEDYEQAAHMHNQCRTSGIAGSPTDFLICAVASRRKLRIFTTDGDFAQYRKVLPIQLHAMA